MSLELLLTNSSRSVPVGPKIRTPFFPDTSLVVSTVSRLFGEEVPIPTLPAFVTIKSVLVEEPTTNDGESPVLDALTESSPQGLEVPMPVKPAPVTVRNVVALEVEAIWKSGVVCVVVACTARLAKGVVVPSPKRPVAESKINWVPFKLPKRTVDDA